MAVRLNKKIVKKILQSYHTNSITKCANVNDLKYYIEKIEKDN